MGEFFQSLIRYAFENGIYGYSDWCERINTLEIINKTAGFFKWDKGGYPAAFICGGID
jgi:hypothetical protein